MRDINYLLCPPRFQRFKARLADQSFALLDVGCTNGSSLLAKHWFPKCTYHGLDLSGAWLSPAERQAIDKFIECNLDDLDLSSIPDNSYDVIVFAHVIEHLAKGLDVLAALATKLRPGGHLYVEFPSVHSLSLPSAYNTLNFSDDPTHIRLYDVKEVANVLMAAGLRVVRGGRRQDWMRMLLSPLTLPRQVRSILVHGTLDARGLWDLLGFANFVYALRPASDNQPTATTAP